MRIVTIPNYGYSGYGETWGGGYGFGSSYGGGFSGSSHDYGLESSEGSGWCSDTPSDIMTLLELVAYAD